MPWEEDSIFNFEHPQVLEKKLHIFQNLIKSVQSTSFQSNQLETLSLQQFDSSTWF